MSAQQKFWDVLAEKYPDEKEREKYVCNPKQGGRHTRGTAVDCVLIHLETGQELEKPSDFDHFGPEAWRDYNGPKLTAKAKEHRELLEQIMEKHGFKGVKCEWWHYDYNGWKDCKPFDVEF
jgi:D-alanyl-D-alanine dipeptidase